MLLTCEIRNAIIDVLLLNIYSERNAGYASGKSGLALTLLNVAHYMGSKYEYLEDHSLSLLEEVLAMNIDLPTFMNGNAGIGFVLNSIINNRLIDADYSDLFSKQTTDIITTIKVKKHDDDISAECLDYMFFINAIQNRISQDDISTCNDILISLIDSRLKKFEKRLESGMARNEYYPFAIRLMAAINALQAYQDKYAIHAFNIIRKNEFLFHELDYICQYPIYYFYLYLTDKCIYRQNVSASINQMFDESLKNIFTETMSFKELIDSVYLLSRIKAISADNKNMLSTTMYKMLSAFTDSDKTSFESKLKQTLYRSAGYNIGISGGLSRLLILDCFWDDMTKGVFPRDMTLLFF